MQSLYSAPPAQDPVTGRGAPDRWTSFLWWLATAEKELLAGARTDQNRYAIVGYTVLGTWAFASLAWTYFFSTVTGSLPAAMMLGLFMGALILIIDRALIKGIQAKQRNRWRPLLFRGLLAAAIGTFMAQPALLYLFRKEIQLQTVTDNQHRMQAQQRLTDSLYNGLKAPWQSRKLDLQQRLDSSLAGVNHARESFLAEADGSGGTRKAGISTIARAKEKAYLQLDSAHRALAAQILPGIRIADSALLDLEQQQQQALRNYAAFFNDGFLTRIEALQHLTAAHPALQFRYYLLLAILLLIELMPVLTKSLLPAGTYEERLALLEQLEKEQSAAILKREAGWLEHYNQQAYENDCAAVTDLFARIRAGNQQGWADPPNRSATKQPSSFRKAWHTLKAEQLAGQRWEGGIRNEA